MGGLNFYPSETFLFQYTWVAATISETTLNLIGMLVGQEALMGAAVKETLQIDAPSGPKHSAGKELMR